MNLQVLVAPREPACGEIAAGAVPGAGQLERKPSWGKLTVEYRSTFRHHVCRVSDACHSPIIRDDHRARTADIARYSHAAFRVSSVP